MADNTVTLAIDGEVTLALFASAVSDLSVLMEHLTTFVVREADIQWVIEHLDGGSAVVTARAEGADMMEARGVTEAYLDIGRAIASGQSLDYPGQINSRARKLVALTSERIPSIRFENSEADVVIEHNKNYALQTAGLDAPDPSLYGAVEGVVQTLSNRHGLRFALYDSVFDKAVSCYLESGQEDIMRNAWGRRAIVEGIVNRNADDGRPLSVRRISHVELVTDYPPGSYRLARGILPRQPGDALPEDAIRRVRDAE